VHWITSRLNFAVYDSLLDFWRPSSITTVLTNWNKYLPCLNK
jgi:hypothetical protein